MKNKWSECIVGMKRSRGVDRSGAGVEGEWSGNRIGVDWRLLEQEWRGSDAGVEWSGVPQSCLPIPCSGDRPSKLLYSLFPK